jgi:MoxR-like ATPase
MLHWQRIAQAWALLQDRDFVTPSDVKKVAHPVLSVRLLTTTDDVDSVISQIMTQVSPPEYK